MTSFTCTDRPILSLVFSNSAIMVSPFMGNKSWEYRVDHLLSNKPLSCFLILTCASDPACDISEQPITVTLHPKRE